MPSNIGLVVGLAVLAVLGAAYAWFPTRQLLRLPLEKYVERRVRSNPQRYQPEVWTFHVNQYSDPPGSFNCFADTADVRPEEHRALLWA